MPLLIEKGNSYDRKKAKGKCVAKNCGNKAYRYKGANSKCNSCLCSRHRRQRQKEINPLGYFYDLLHQNAKRRGKIFGITICDFKAFCEETGYLAKKGRGANNMTIDCIDPHKGYVRGNIQILTNSQNVRKRYVPYWIKQEELLTSISLESLAAQHLQEDEVKPIEEDIEVPF